MINDVRALEKVVDEPMEELRTPKLTSLIQDLLSRVVKLNSHSYIIIIIACVCFKILPHIPALQPYHSRSWFLHPWLHIFHLPQSSVGSVYRSALRSQPPGQHSNLVKRQKPCTLYDAVIRWWYHCVLFMDTSVL